MSTAVACPARPRLSAKTQTIAAIAATVGAVVLPPVFHLMGMLSGLGALPGEIFLPMHLPILLVGLLAGPYAGAAAGLLAPAISFVLTGMPGAAMLPFMMLELCGYGLAAGLLRSSSMPTIAKVLIAQVAGRALRAAAILIAVYGFGSATVSVSIVWTSLATGIIGLVLQWALLPLLVYRVDSRNKN